MGRVVLSTATGWEDDLLVGQVATQRVQRSCNQHLNWRHSAHAQSRCQSYHCVPDCQAGTATGITAGQNRFVLQ